MHFVNCVSIAVHETTNERARLLQETLVTMYSPCRVYLFDTKHPLLRPVADIDVLD